jgi:hypothetical protein
MTRKIYFAGSIRGGRTDSHKYAELIDHLKRYGTVLTEHVGSPDLTSQGEGLPKREIYKRDISFIKEAELMVAEVSTPSLGVGYEIAKATEANIPILCLFCEDNSTSLSAMIEGSPFVITKYYSDTIEAKKYIDDFINQL